jgi:glycerophosphoryl diester phosphodiesterase
MYTIFPLPTIFAHRGASMFAPENTISAFELAVSQNADAIELDAKCSADGKVVVFHDQTVNRTTDGDGKVGELSLSELKELDAGSWFHTDFAGEQIPTLGEVFEAVGQKILINIELTNYASPWDELPNKVVDLVFRHGLQNRVIFSSFNPIALQKTRSLAPDILAGLLALPGYKGVWARTWLNRFIPHHALHPEVSDTTLNLIQKQHKAGKRVNVWTVNSEEKIRQLLKWGIDGIITDDPVVANKVKKQAA